ncbi:hypothetical protein UU9_12717 [Rhodanobacter fulvus Jip2]|uniref:DUF600 family protein n=1 Tax=Rhodanobacter fulvus Jip2 TaxID=1163408 RepID=I4VMH8_9GAMM|nr:hypothetical protein UU9_12717 [Rhodanobacter fulvus Jip2]
MYQEIGQLLVDSGPVNAQKITVRAKIFPNNDGGRYEFDYIDDVGGLSWFNPDSRAVGDLTDTLVKLRNFFAKNNLSSGEKIWSECEINLDVKNMKIGIDFKYGE